MHVVIDPARVSYIAFFRFPLSNLNITVSLTASHIHPSLPSLALPISIDRKHFSAHPTQSSKLSRPDVFSSSPHAQWHPSGYHQELYLLVAEYNGRRFGFLRILQMVDVITLSPVRSHNSVPASALSPMHQYLDSLIMTYFKEMLPLRTWS